MRRIGLIFIGFILLLAILLLSLLGAGYWARDSLSQQFLLPWLSKQYGLEVSCAEWRIAENLQGVWFDKVCVDYQGHQLIAEQVYIDQTDLSVARADLRLSAEKKAKL